jgi:hypothetical protein
MADEAGKPNSMHTRSCYPYTVGGLTSQGDSNLHDTSNVPEGLCYYIEVA